MKFNIVNKDRSNAYVTVRLKKEQFLAIAEYMHQRGEDEIRFPSGVTLVHQSSGHYRFWGHIKDEAPTRVLTLAIKIASKALAIFQAHLTNVCNARPLAYVEGKYVNTRLSQINQNTNSRNSLGDLSVLARKFNIKQSQKGRAWAAGQNA